MQQTELRNRLLVWPLPCSEGPNLLRPRLETVMMPFYALLILAYGPLNWSFPWWLWVITFLFDGVATVVKVREKKE